MPDMGENVHVEVTGNSLVITIDLTQNCGLSKSGKTIKVASTGGSQKIPGKVEYILGLNVNKKINSE